jgi:hypothetical protein
VSTEVKKEIELEIAYVLFIDIVGYSKLLVDQQRRLLEILNEIVRGTEQFQRAEVNNRLITIPRAMVWPWYFTTPPKRRLNARSKSAAR